MDGIDDMNLDMTKFQPPLGTSPEVAGHGVLEQLLAWVAAWTLLAVSGTAGAALPAPTLAVSPNPSSGAYTVDWSGNPQSFEDTYDLQESSNGGSTWVTVANDVTYRTKTFTKTSDGPLSYRLRHCITPLRGDGGGGQTCSGWSSVKTVNVYTRPGTPSMGGINYTDRDGVFLVSWSPVSGHTTKYRLFESRDNAGWVKIAETSPSVRRFEFTSPKSDAVYQYKVDACNTVNSSCGTDSAPKTVTVLKTPTAPTNLQMPADNTSGTFTLTWNAASETVSHYEILRIRHGEATYDVIGSSPTTSFTYPVNHPDGDFNYRVKACNETCSARSGYRTISVLKVPTMPLNVSLPAESLDGSFTLSWDPSFETVDYYQIDRAEEGRTCPGTNFQFCTIGTATGPSKAFAGHDDGTFYFKVRACNASGCSDRSASVGLDVEKSLAGLEDAEPFEFSRPERDLVGTLPGTPSLDGGKVNYRIDIPVPPGRQGMAPAVSLSYSSGSGEGLAGVGWSLSAGQGSVYRCPSLEAIDGRTRPYSGAVDDRLCLNGEQLMLASGSYGAVDSIYHPETRPFLEVELEGGSSRSSGSYFEVTDRAGNAHRYARVVLPPRADDEVAYPTHWLLTRITDLEGNRIDYEYSASSEEPLLERVRYTGKGAEAGTRTVNFAYADRPQRSVHYTSQGFRTVSSQRLASITTKVGGTVVHHVPLRYEISDATGRSLLAGVRLCGDTQCDAGYPESTFTYSEQDQVFVERILSEGELVALEEIGDVDGDGQGDYVVTGQDNRIDPPQPIQLRLSSLAEPLELGPWMNTGLRLDGAFRYDRPRADFNSDGRDDLIGVQDDQVKIGIWNLQERRIDELDTNLQAGDFFHVIAAQDFDRDGDADLYIQEERNGMWGRYVLFNCSGELTAELDFCREYPLPAEPDGLDGRLVEYSGDLLPDFVYTGVDDSGGVLSTRVRFGQVNDGAYSLGPLLMLGDDLGGPSKLNAAATEGQTRMLDVNGDGLSDIYRQHSTGSTLWLNTGGRFQTVNLVDNIDLDDDLASGLIVMDYDRDGRDDLLAPAELAQGGNYCYLFRAGPGQEDQLTCSGSGGVARFEDGALPHLNRGIYTFDQVHFVQQADDSFTMTRAATPLEGPIHASAPCDRNDDGQLDLCYQLTKAYAVTNDETCDPDFDEFGCAFPFGSYTNANLVMGRYALEVDRGQSAFGFDLLSEAANGLGFLDTWEYGALSGAGHSGCTYTSERPFYTVDPYAARPGHYHFNASMHVVTRHSTSNGVGGMNAQCLRYEDAMFSTGGRGFQGFRAISVDEALGDGHDKIVRTEYYDSFPLTGKTRKVQTRLVSDEPGLNPLSESLQDWAYLQHPNGSYFVYPLGRRGVVYDFDRPERPELSRTLLFNHYDPEQGGDLANGNLSYQIAATETLSPTGDVLVRNQTRTDYDYDYSEAESGWRDKLERKTVTVSPTYYGESLAGPQPDAGSNNEKVLTEDYTYSTDGKRRLATKTVQAGVATEQARETYGYDNWGNVKVVTVTELDDNASRTHETHYDAGEGYFPQRLEDAKGFNTYLSYDPGLGVVVEQHNPDGVTIQQDYDFAGNLIQTRSSIAPPIDRVTQWCAVASECGQAVAKTMVIQDGQPVRTQYVDRLGRVVKEAVQGIAWGGPDCGFGFNCETVVTTTYDARGRKTAESQPGGSADAYQTRYLEYDSLDRYGRKVVDRSGHLVGSQTWRYAHQGLSTTITLPDGSLTATRTFDASGNLLSTTDAAGSTTHHRYDGQGHKILTRNAAGTQVHYYFDNLGRKVRVEDPDAGTADAPAELLTYNGFGELVETRNANGDVIRTVYDELGRPTMRGVNSITNALWVYDVNGKPSLSREESGDANGNGVPDTRTVFHHDDFGRLVKTELSIDGSPRTFIDEVAYDGNYGRIKGRKYASGELVRYRYTPFGQLEKVAQPWGKQVGNLVVDAKYYDIEAQNHRGQVERIDYGRHARGYVTHVDSTGDTESILYETTDGGVLADLRYYYEDAFGNLSRRESVVPGVTETFTYDNLQRLDSSSTIWDDASIEQRTVDYDYDAVGNLTRKDDFGLVYDYGNSERSAGGNAGPHAVYRVERTDGSVLEDFQYDDAGNMTAGNGRAVVYNVFNKPVQITEAGKVSRFRYGPDLSLVIREEDDKTVFYGADYQLVIGPGGVETERTMIGSHVVVEKTGAGRKVRYQHYDRLGSLILVTDEDGNATETHGFDAFGKPLAGDWQDNGGLLHSGANAEEVTEKGFTGHEHLDGHKLVHMGGRIYDPLLGRFMSVDPYIQSETSTQSQNAYSYVMNNPLSGIDPSGYACLVANIGGEIHKACETDDSQDGRSPEDQAAMNHIDHQIANGRTFETATVVEAERMEDGHIEVGQRHLTNFERELGHLVSFEARYRAAYLTKVTTRSGRIVRKPVANDEDFFDEVEMIRIRRWRSEKARELGLHRLASLGPGERKALIMQMGRYDPKWYAEYYATAREFVEGGGRKALTGPIFESMGYKITRAAGGTHEQAMSAAAMGGAIGNVAGGSRGVVRRRIGSYSSVGRGQPMHQPVREQSAAIYSDHVRMYVTPRPRGPQIMRIGVDRIQ